MTTSTTKSPWCAEGYIEFRARTTVGQLGFRIDQLFAFWRRGDHTDIDEHTNTEHADDHLRTVVFNTLAKLSTDHIEPTEMSGVTHEQIIPWNPCRPFLPIAFEEKSQNIWKTLKDPAKERSFQPST